MTTPMVRLRPFEAGKDPALVLGWLQAGHARFWQLAPGGVESLHAHFERVAAAPGRRLWTAVAGDDPRAVCLVETYDPALDLLGTHYAWRIGDRGFHMLMAPPSLPVPGLSRAVLIAVADLVFQDEEVQRLVAEPDLRNAKMLRLAQRSGFELGPVLQLPHKTALLAVLTRRRHLERPRDRPPPGPVSTPARLPMLTALLVGAGLRLWRRMRHRLRAGLTAP